MIRLAILIWTLLEIAVFIWLGKMIGMGWTLLLVLISMAIGFMMLRIQGFALLRDMAAKSRYRQLEPSDMMNMSFVAMGGVLFILPGFISDFIGLLCFIPAVRRRVIRWIILAIAVPGTRPPTSPSHHTIDHD